MKSVLRAEFAHLNHHLRSAFAEKPLAWTFVLAAIIVLLEERYGWQESFRQFAESRAYFAGMSERRLGLLAQAYYAATSLLSYLVIPLVFDRLLPVAARTKFGVRGGRPRTGLILSFATLAAVLPVVWFAGRLDSFATYYPLYRAEGAGDRILYYVLYGLQVFCVEFFFRGFLLFRLEHYLAALAVPVAALPYTLLHIRKPIAEAIGSLAAGLFLGAFALANRSIWPGVLLHAAVAVCLDFAAMKAR